MTLWFVRGGSYGEHESKFINEHKVCLTRGELTATDMPTIADYGGIKQRVTQDDNEVFEDKMWSLTEKLAEQMAQGTELDALIRKKLAGVGYGI